MINVIASLHIKEGGMSAFLDIFKANVPNVMQEKGCIEYAPAIDVATGLPPQIMNENVVTVIEKWASMEDLRTHLAAPHMQTYRESVKDLVLNVSLKVLTAA